MNAVLHENPMERFEAVYSTDQIIELSGETVVPDKMPDIGLLGDTNAHVLLRGKRVEAGHGTIEGEMVVSTSFLPDGAVGICVLNMEIPWRMDFESDKISDTNATVVDVRVIRLETRLLNPRKILVKAKLCAEIAVYGKQVVTVYDNIEETNAIQVRRESIACSVVSAVCEKTFVATDEYPIPADMTNVEIIGKNVQFRVDDVKSLTNKLIVKGTVLSDVLIVSDTGASEKISFTSGFSFIAETNNERVSADVSVSIMPTAMFYEPASGGRTISVEVHGVCQIVSYERIEIQYMADAYSNFYPCECTYEEVSVYAERKRELHRENLTGTVSCHSQVERVWFLTVGGVFFSGNEKPEINAQIGLCVQYENGTTDWLKASVPMTIKKQQNERVSGLRVGELYGSSNGTEIEYRLTVEYELWEEDTMEIKMLSSIMLEEERPYEHMHPSIVVVRSGRSLWDLAQEYRSTVDLIRTYNELEDEECRANTLLLIPRQRP